MLQTKFSSLENKIRKQIENKIELLENKMEAMETRLQVIEKKPRYEPNIPARRC